jgi:mono/diheme cytochrome c family protein
MRKVSLRFAAVVNYMNQINPAAWCIGPIALGILSSVLILVSGCAPDRDKPLSGPQAAARGAVVFDYNCGFCHGTEGRGPPLSELKSLSKEERRGRIINHPISGQIPQRLQAHEISDLNEFFNSE